MILLPCYEEGLKLNFNYVITEIGWKTTPFYRVTLQLKETNTNCVIFLKLHSTNH